MTRRIIQFGAGRFLQAHVDLFVHEARCSGEDIGPIAMVKTSPAPHRASRIFAFKRGVPYPVRILGVAAGKVFVTGNSPCLAQIVSNLAEESRQSDALRDWLARPVIFADTSVDRIVS